MKLNEILIEQKEEIEEKISQTSIVEREMSEFAKGFLNSKLVKITTGIRRSGKSFFTSLLLRRKKFGYVNFDDERLLYNEPNEILSSLIETYGKDMQIIFFDEIQNLKNWEFFVNRLHRSNYNIFITGSNAKLLSKELATHLTGRHITFEIFPFSFREYLAARKFKENLNTTKGRSLVKRELNEYMSMGGFPEIVVEGENPKIYLRELYASIIERDIILRYNVAYKKTFKEIAISLISNFTRSMSYNRIRKQFKIGSDHTAKNYISYMEEAYLLFPLSKFSYKPKEIERSEKKIYVMDTGFINHIAYKFREDKGHIIENLVAIDLLRRKSLERNLDLYYYKDYQQREVDFVLKQGERVQQLIQVCYDIDDFNTKGRELKSLVKASKQLNCNNLLVITWDYEAKEEFKGKTITFKPLWKWLLNL